MEDVVTIQDFREALADFSDSRPFEEAKKLSDEELLEVKLWNLGERFRMDSLDIIELTFILENKKGTSFDDEKFFRDSDGSVRSYLAILSKT